MAKAAFKKRVLAIEYVATESLIPYENNAKLHPESQVAEIALSIQSFGFNDPIAVDEKNGVIEGHGRLEAAKKLNLKEVPIIRLENLTNAEKRAYILAHNKLTLKTGFDLDMVRMEVDSILNAGLSIELTGFENFELEIPDLGKYMPEETEGKEGDPVRGKIVIRCFEADKNLLLIELREFIDSLGLSEVEVKEG